MSQTHSESLERRVVVLGANGAEKTFVISALLGQTEYEIAKSSGDCVRTTAQINGRTFTCVDTPGWWRNYSAVDTAEYIKRKLVLSVLECPPGPHVFLLVVRSEVPFGGQERRAFEQHLGLFGDNIWEHIIVVFTSGEGQKTKSIKEHIEGGGEALKWLVSKCGNRYHMLHSLQKGDKSAVTELLAGIDEVVTENNGSYFRCEDRILEYVEEKRKADKEKAASRVHMIGNMRKMNEKVVAYSAPELQLLLVGWLVSGKTFARKTILGLKDIERKRTNQTSRKSEEINGRQISVVDTPGWYKYMPAQYLPNWVKAEIQRGLMQDSKHPHAVLLAIPVCTAFQEEQRKITEDNMKMMFGERVWRHTIVLFTAGDMLGDTSIEEHIEAEGEPLRWLVEKCGNRYHVLSWSDEKDTSIVDLLRKVDEMVPQNSVFYTESKSENVAYQEDIEEKDALQKPEIEWEKIDDDVKKELENIWNQNADTKRKSKGADIDFCGSLFDRELARLDISTTERFQPLLST